MLLLGLINETYIHFVIIHSVNFTCETSVAPSVQTNQLYLESSNSRPDGKRPQDINERVVRICFLFSSTFSTVISHIRVGHLLHIIIFLCCPESVIGTKCETVYLKSKLSLIYSKSAKKVLDYFCKGLLRLK